MNYGKLKNLIGIPWIYKESDCWAIFKRGLLDVFDRESYSFILPEVSSTEENAKIFKAELKPPRWVKSKKCHAGCAVIFYDKENEPIHIGLSIDDKTVLHSMGATGMNTSSRIDKIKVIMRHRLYSRCEFYDYCI